MKHDRQAHTALRITLTFRIRGHPSVPFDPRVVLIDQCAGNTLAGAGNLRGFPQWYASTRDPSDFQVYTRSEPNDRFKWPTPQIWPD